MGARTRSKAGKDHRGDVVLLGIYRRGRLTHGPRRWFISACRNASARTEVLELMTHNAKGEVIDAYTSWEWSTLCNEIMKLDLSPPTSAKLLPLAKSVTPQFSGAFEGFFASDFATRDQSETISDAYQWRRWESNRRASAHLAGNPVERAEASCAGCLEKPRVTRFSGMSRDTVRDTRGTSCCASCTKGSQGPIREPFSSQTTGRWKRPINGKVHGSVGDVQASSSVLASRRSSQPRSSRHRRSWKRQGGVAACGDQLGTRGAPRRPPSRLCAHLARSRRGPRGSSPAPS